MRSPNWSKAPRVDKLLRILSHSDSVPLKSFTGTRETCTSQKWWPGAWEVELVEVWSREVLDRKHILSFLFEGVHPNRNTRCICMTLRKPTACLIEYSTLLINHSSMNFVCEMVTLQEEGLLLSMRASQGSWILHAWKNHMWLWWFETSGFEDGQTLCAAFEQYVTCCCIQLHAFTICLVPPTAEFSTSTWIKTSSIHLDGK